MPLARALKPFGGRVARRLGALVYAPGLAPWGRLQQPTRTFQILLNWGGAPRGI